MSREHYCSVVLPEARIAPAAVYLACSSQHSLSPKSLLFGPLTVSQKQRADQTLELVELGLVLRGYKLTGPWERRTLVSDTSTTYSAWAALDRAWLDLDLPTPIDFESVLALHERGEWVA